MTRDNGKCCNPYYYRYSREFTNGYSSKYYKMSLTGLSRVRRQVRRVSYQKFTGRDTVSILFLRLFTVFLISSFILSQGPLFLSLSRGFVERSQKKAILFSFCVKTSLIIFFRLHRIFS